MATTTPNLGLVKPELQDNFNLKLHLNDNFDRIDEAFNINRYSSRSKIYGVSFDINSEMADCTRIADAVGLEADYVIHDISGKETYQLNGGTNDFDNIYPWCDIRRCNVKLENGKKKITYEGETGFTLDGSNGNVMVEIPKFYFMRERIGNTENWCITGEAKGGFKIEPAFVVNGEEQDYIYISCYEADISVPTSGTYSKTGTFVTMMKKMLDYETVFQSAGYSGFDITTLALLQHLIVIEFGTRNLKQYMGGYGNAHYYSGQKETAITAVSENTVIFKANASKTNNRWTVGEQVEIVKTAGHTDGIIKTIEEISYNSDGTATLTYDGDDISSSIELNAHCVTGCVQKTGKTDSIQYHTGRTQSDGFIPNSEESRYRNCFKYRHIENLWNNAWSFVNGLVVKNLKYYLSTEPNDFLSVADNYIEWETVSFDAPEQTVLGESGKAWLLQHGYDCNERILSALPSKCYVEGVTGTRLDGKYYDGCYYSGAEDSDLLYCSICGGGYDHRYFGGIFTLRNNHSFNIYSPLYGQRMVLRKIIKTDSNV